MDYYFIIVNLFIIRMVFVGFIFLKKRKKEKKNSRLRMMIMKNRLVKYTFGH